VLDQITIQQGIYFGIVATDRFKGLTPGNLIKSSRVRAFKLKQKSFNRILALKPCQLNQI